MKKVLIIDNGTSYLESLVSVFALWDVHVVRWDQVSVFGIHNFDLVVLSGGHQFPVMGNENALAHEIQLVQNTEAPILGICFGCELIARSFGATLERMESKEKGIMDIIVINADPLFPDKNKFQVYESHRWVIRKLPDALVGLAISKDGIEVLKHKTKPIYGFQFHPEMFPNVSDGDILFSNFIKIVNL